MFSKISIQNIRVFKKASFHFDEGVNLIVGPNGSGKTTVLESLALFSFGRFQSVEKDQMAIRLGEEVGRIEATIIQDQSSRQVELAMTPAGKTMKIDSKKLPASQMVGVQRSVLFNPETINLVSGAPQLRRRELDLTIAQKHTTHIKILLEYRQILRQRNELLKRIALDFSDLGELDFWDKQLSEHATRIVREREAFIKQANLKVGAVYKGLLGRDRALSLRYLKSADYGDFLGALKHKRGYDIKSGLTSVGPHRDDFCFETGSFKLEEGASRGEQRLAAFAFKLIERDYLTDEKHIPVLLMDDVFSELDSGRRDMVVKVLDGGQIILTATDEKVMPSMIRERGKVITL